MAQVSFYRPASMETAYAPGGEVLEAEATRIVLADGVAGTLYQGAFTYSDSDALTGGTITGYGAFTGDVSNFAWDYVVQGVAVNALQAAPFIDRGDLPSLNAAALAGADTLRGSAGADAMLAHAGADVAAGNGGNDRIDTGAGDDLLLGGAGDDTLAGGAGTDTASTAALRRQTSVSDPAGASGALSGPEGADTLSSIEVLRFTDGALYLAPDTVGAGVGRLYLATLGRPADAIGLGAWSAALEAGALSPNDAVSGFTGSAEFAQRYGAPDNTGFVTLLYGNVLGRAPDAEGLAFWSAALNSGAATRQQTVLGFSDSAEFKAQTAGALANGLWAPDPAAVDVLRAYLATLDRLPDAAGLASWTAAREAGATAQQVEAAFIGSAEFGAKYGDQSNAGFVQLLYRNALDREADADGLAFWAGALDAGRVSRADVVHEFASSAEMTAKVLPLVSDGVAFV